MRDAPEDLEAADDLEEVAGERGARSPRDCQSREVATRCTKMYAIAYLEEGQQVANTFSEES